MEQQLLNSPGVLSEGYALVANPTLPADRHPAFVYLASLAPGSRRTMLLALNVIAKWISGGRADAQVLCWERLRYQHSQLIRAELANRYAPATTNKMIAALRGVLKEAWRLGLVSAEDFHRAIDVKPVKSSSLPRGRALSPGELHSLFEACADGTQAGVRDAALLGACYGCGLRRSEVVGLDLEDFNPEDRAVTVRGGKGRKDRVVYAPVGSGHALTDWISLRGSTPGPLFYPVDKGNRILVRRLTGQTVFGVVRKRGDQAGIVRFSPHDLRRTFVSDLLDAGADISTTKRMAGHSSEVTTGRYDRRGEESKRKAAKLLHVPYVRRTS